jgi:hypothetical protein
LLVTSATGQRWPISSTSSIIAEFRRSPSDAAVASVRRSRRWPWAFSA